ncbi:prespore-specific regulator [Halobacillus karajensis]|uniref:Prespore-specific transcriptional regulator RsfA n=1 Tax=Halobacillus karajensis TaxID=195088 RepID=A0A024P712_9BACI|nr:RsfA family transcriptional regulator [Halobacillus karajensis]CDQ18100.1 Prespore-specific transcriptional regulator RsfA [Halobacillus karajensis]CDQ24451.1 Prespore-specific transcriptional regulator RsfA [Halobacillus karajensis]CDQ29301.1 Prespore-specific transcriptional regulator RsfA [Halobacillus karajensis]SEH59282.1 prespore-specific regulator [Halobacillus karajensis]
MPKVRQDAWSHEDDLLLAETVLRHIREGSTQLKAFDEVGDILNRTSAACGFRWNAEVRQKYEQAVELAKKQRKEKKRKEANQQPAYQRKQAPVLYQPEEEEEDFLLPEPMTADVHNVKRDNHQQEIELEDVISYLTHLKAETTDSDRLSELEQQNKKLASQNQELKSKLESMTEDYQALIQIMDRARKMVMFDESDAYKPQFRMEKNGNLENVAR